MISLMMDLLDQAQIQKNTFSLNQEFFPLLQAIEQSISIVKHTADKKRVELVIKEAEGPKQEIQIFGDLSRYQQIMINFLSNALKFS